MSHIVQIQTEVKDPTAIAAAAARIGLPEPVHGETTLYSGVRSGWRVELPGWRYPLVCDVSAGRIDYDNFNGRWGAQQELDRFLQAYAIERARLEAQKNGCTVQEQPLADGSVKLTITLGGAA